MKALAVLVLLLGVMALLQRPADFSAEEARIVAMNYAIYRQATLAFVRANKGFSGEIPLASLDLPASWRALRPWHARVQGGFCYVYGEASPQEAEAVRQLFRESLAVGLADQGRIVPALRHPVPVPAFVSNGSVVSVTEAGAA